MAQVPVLVVHELEVRQGEFGLQEYGELLLDGLGPLAYQYDELVLLPHYSASIRFCF